MTTNQSNFAKKVQQAVALQIHLLKYSKKVWNLLTAWILLNCFKNLDKQVKELYTLAQSKNEKHIKGEKQLLDLTESINFMTKKIWWLWER